MLSGEYIYLHFMDRELRGSLGIDGHKLDKAAKVWVKAALLMTDMPLYVSLSHMYESKAEMPRTIHFLYELEKLGKVRMVSNHSNQDEFLESRQSLYLFDRNRYEVYFGKKRLDWPTDIYIDNRGTTKYLREAIFSTDNLGGIPKKIEDKIKESMISNKNDAITIQRFDSLIKKKASKKKKYHQVTTNMRITISKLYTKRYLETFGGTIITGLPGFAVYDELAKKPVYADFRLFDVLMQAIPQSIIDDDERFVGELSSVNSGIWYKDIFREICEYGYSLVNSGEATIDWIRAVIFRNKKNGSSSDELEFRWLFAAHNELKNICKERDVKVETQAYSILIILATQTELKILLTKVREFYPVEAHIANDISYHTTMINGNIVYIVKCQMGAGGSGGSTLTTKDAIDKLKPDMVIMCGIAWGGDEKSQSIGDVLVSTKVWDYDLKKVKEDTEIQRGDIRPASAQLLRAFETSTVLEQRINVHFGMIASGSLLLDNKAEVEHLKSIQPELIGGEMEIAGVASACEHEKTYWIMVKGICDWGYGKQTAEKEKHQKIAAENAVYIVLEMLKKYGG